MQLFHQEYSIQNNNLIISNSDTINQCRKVLRLKKGDLIHVQSTQNNITTRHLVKILEISKTLITDIIETTTKTKSENTTKILIAMPNKFDKLEIITQKLTEIGIDDIVFRPAERSIIKQRNTNKEQRLQNIIKEAVEQSRWWFLPNIFFNKNPEESLQETSNIYIFDKKEHTTTTIEKASNITGIIGPEWWLTTKDYDRFKKYNPKIYTLGESILRMETAAIIWSWIIKNN